MHKSGRFTLLAMVLAAAGTVAAQLDTPRVRPEDDTRDLYARAAKSQFVILGTVLRSGIVSKRIPHNDIDALKASVDNPVDGHLFSISVSEVICSQSDFDRRNLSGASTKPGSVLHVFVPQREPHFKNAYGQEFLLRGRSYLLFLVLPSKEEQSRWTTELELDPAETYYRTLEYSRGAALLPSTAHDRSESKQPALVGELTALCRAVRPSNAPEKLIELQKLANSDDPVLRREAEVAKKALLERSNQQNR